MARNNILYIHIGMDKCGTSSIHSYLDDNKNELLKQNLFYLDTYDFNQLFPIDTKFENYILKSNKLFKNKDVIISNRTLYTNIPNLLNSLHQLHELFMNYTIKIIMYVPKLDDWCKKLYIQEFDHADSTYHDYNSYLFNMVSTVKKFPILINKFGKENVIFRIFDKTKLKNHDIIEDIVNIISKDRYCPIDVKNTTYRRNPTISSFSTDMPYKMALLTNRDNTSNKLYNYSYKTRKECLQVVDESFNMEYCKYDCPPPLEVIDTINEFVPGYADLYKNKPFDLNDVDFKYNKEILCLSNLVYLCIDKINELTESFKSLKSNKFDTPYDNDGGGVIRHVVYV